MPLSLRAARPGEAPLVLAFVKELAVYDASSMMSKRRKPRSMQRCSARAGTSFATSRNGTTNPSASRCGFSTSRRFAAAMASTSRTCSSALRIAVAQFGRAILRRLACENASRTTGRDLNGRCSIGILRQFASHESCGAQMMSDWRICRVSGEAAATPGGRGRSRRRGGLTRVGDASRSGGSALPVCGPRRAACLRQSGSLRLCSICNISVHSGNRGFDFAFFPPGSAPTLRGTDVSAAEGRSANRSKTIANVQALRALAALSVVFGHLGGLPSLHKVVYFSDAGAGVDLFFVLSGFVIGNVVATSSPTLLQFMLARAGRIYPLYWIVLFISTPTLTIFRSALSGSAVNDLGYFTTSFLLLPTATADGHIYPSLLVAWTLVYEILFYALAAVLLTTGRSHFWAKLGVALFAAYLLSFLLPPGAWRYVAQHPHTPSGPWTSPIQLPVYFEFLFGAIIAALYSSGRLSGPIVAALIVIAIPAYLYGPPHRVIRFGVPSTVFLALALKLEGCGLRAGRAAVLLGDASYAMYLCHMWLIERVEPITRSIPTLPPVAAALVLLAVVLIGSIAASLLLDRPIQILLRRWIKSMAGTPQPNLGISMPNKTRVQDRPERASMTIAPDNSVGSPSTPSP